MAGKLKELLEICRKTRFLETNFNGPIIGNLKYSGLYQLLRENVAREWQEARDPKISNSIIQSQDPDNLNCYNGQQFIDNYKKFKEKNTMPFSITEILQEHLKLPETGDEAVIKVQPAIPGYLRTSYFIREAIHKEFLYQIQRQHKIRWMKFSVNPQKYSISDQKSRDSISTVSLYSNWEPDGRLEIERLTSFPLKSFLTPENTEIYQFSRKKEVPWIIQSITCLETATLNILLDSLTSLDSIFKFHRRLAPYQISIFKLSEENQDLLDLARFIELLITREDQKIKVLNKSDIKVKNQLELKRELERLDAEIGIPYSIVLDGNSLKTGLLKLRNRNTTLSETIHISDIPGYIVKIFNAI
jgi:DNA polymerase gamma 2